MFMPTEWTCDKDEETSLLCPRCCGQITLHQLLFCTLALRWYNLQHLFCHDPVFRTLLVYEHRAYIRVRLGWYSGGEASVDVSFRDCLLKWILALHFKILHFVLCFVKRIAVFRLVLYMWIWNIEGEISGNTFLCAAGIAVCAMTSLRAARPRNLGANSRQRKESFLYSISSTPVGLIQPPCSVRTGGFFP